MVGAPTLLMMSDPSWLMEQNLAVIKVRCDVLTLSFLGPLERGVEGLIGLGALIRWLLLLIMHNGSQAVLDATGFVQRACLPFQLVDSSRGRLLTRLLDRAHIVGGGNESGRLLIVLTRLWLRILDVL